MSSAEKCLGSPQDLSLAPHVQTPSAAQTSANPSASKSSKSGGQRHSSSSQTNSASKSTANAVASSPSSVSSVSSGEGSGDQSPTHDGSASGKGGAPQIYPWMKRVHLGQSKCHIIHLNPQLLNWNLTRYQRESGEFWAKCAPFSAYRHFGDDSPFGDGSKANFIRITLSDGHGANIHFLLLPISNKFDIKSANRWNWTKFAYQVESSVLSSVVNFSFRNSLKQWL